MKLNRVLMTVLFVLMLAVPVGAERMKLGWDANTEPLDGYIVHRLVSGSEYEAMEIVPCTAGDPVCCEYIGEQLPWETTFFWKVSAFSSGGESPGYSNEVTYTTPPPPLPPLPDNPTGCFIKDVLP